MEEAAPGPAVAAAEENVWSLLDRGKLEKAKNLFLGQVKVNDTDDQGRTPLHLAAEMKDAALAGFFISLGAEVDARDHEGKTPLDISTAYGDGAVAAVLAGAGADIHHPMPGNTSPAKSAVAGGGEFLRALLTRESLESADDSGKTILHLAAAAGRAASTDIILERDKNLTRRDKEGKTALDIALEHTGSRDHGETAERLILAGAYSEDPLFAYFAPAVRSSNYNIRGVDGIAPLHYTARQGYTGYTSFILEKKGDVNIKNASGAAPLHEAVRTGQIKTMEILLDGGADPNIQDAKGNSILHIAAPPEFHREAVGLLLSRGANPNLRDEHGESPLHIAIILNRSFEVVEALLAGGADPSIRNIDGKTPLYLAVENERINCVPLLLDYKSDIFAADNGGLTPYEMAIRVRQGVLPSLITPETVLQSDSGGNTLLHITIKNRGPAGILGLILDNRALVNARNKEGDTGLHLAVRLNEEEAGGLLLSRGSDIFAPNAKGESPLFLAFPPRGSPRTWMLTPFTLSARDGLGNTALHYAAQWQFDSSIALMVKLGAGTEAANATGETPLFVAVKHDAPSTIRALVQAGALSSGRDSLGNSALHIAVQWNAGRAAEALLDMGLDINAHALNGKTPLHDAVRLRTEDIEGILIKRGAGLEVRDNDGNTPLMEAAAAGLPASMERLVELGADPAARNLKGDTPLHLAVALGRGDLAALLLGWGVSIHAKNSRGKSPFENALVSSPRMVRTLLTKDRLNAADDRGSSPLHIAVSAGAPPVMLKTILDLGARISVIDGEGRTPLRIAVDREDWETVKLLADSGADVFLAAGDGITPAELAIGKGSNAVRALFSGKAVNSRDSSGNTILHYAAQGGSLE
ncbi:MAG: ankyrin repeat domain-containing protein, partial [Treponema sp.]|nr:ankyrin repeat domain-containing protein [Treponema sp.]